MDFTGDGELFMLRVRGNSMIDAGIFDGDIAVIREQKTANNGEIVAAMIDGDGMKPADAAKKWVEANKDVWKGWIPA